MPRQQGPLRVVDLGLVPYGEALALQRETREARLAGRAPDTLFLLEHPPTITLGRRGGPSDFITPRDALPGMGFEVYDTDRGGEATYHCPGQLVGYPIVAIRELGLSVPRFVELLEQTLIACLAGLHLRAQRREGSPGVWVGGRKIGAIGVHLKRWVSMHGFALNVCPDLKHFEAIVPCGMEDAEVTSIEAELGRSPAMDEVKERISTSFRRAFGYGGVETEAAMTSR